MELSLYARLRSLAHTCRMDILLRKNINRKRSNDFWWILRGQSLYGVASRCSRIPCTYFLFWSRSYSSFTFTLRMYSFPFSPLDPSDRGQLGTIRTSTWIVPGGKFLSQFSRDNGTPRPCQPGVHARRADSEGDRTETGIFNRGNHRRSGGRKI